jgi:hypothetical protein
VDNIPLRALKAGSPSAFQAQTKSEFAFLELPFVAEQAEGLFVPEPIGSFCGFRIQYCAQAWPLLLVVECSHHWVWFWYTISGSLPF